MLTLSKKPNQNRLAPKLSLVATALFAISNTAIAQEAIEEIIVTGEKIERSLQDTASSIAVFSETQITESAIYDIQDIFDRLANVNGANGNESFTIRGINDRNVGAQGSSSLASFHIDGAFISQNGVQAGQSDLWDVSQVEVFRGPQSTTQGRNSLAGAIFINTNDPTYEPEGQYRIAYGSDNTRALSFAYGEALIEDQLAFRIAVDDQATDGFIDNVLLDDDEYGDSSNTTIRAKLLIEPKAIPGLSILNTYSFSRNEAGDIFASLIDADGNDIDPFDAEVFANVEGIENIDQTIFTTEINYDINDIWSFTSISSYNETEFDRQDDDDRQAFGGDALRSRKEIDDTFTQEFRFNFSSDKSRGLIGSYYFKSDLDQGRNDLATSNTVGNLQVAVANTLTSRFGVPQGIANLIGGLYPEDLLFENTTQFSRSIENFAAFGNIEYDVNDFVTVFAGARYDVENIENITESVIVPVGLPSPSNLTGQTAATVQLVNNEINELAPSEDLDNDTDFSAFLPKIGVTLNWSQDLATSFTIQRAYRAGGSGTTAAGNFEFDEELTTNYDLSLRSQWFDNRLTVNANLFYVDWTDQQVTVRDQRPGNNNNDAITLNVGESSLKGAEVDISWVASDVLSLYANIGYVDTEFDSFDVESFADETQDLTGNEFNNAPKITASSGFSYDILPSLRFQTDINYQDESFDDPENDSENDSRTVVNSKVTYHVNDNIEVAVVARNLFDREYLLRNDSLDNNTVLIGQPRTVLVQLQGQF